MAVTISEIEKKIMKSNEIRLFEFNSYEKKFGGKKTREIKNHFIRPLCNKLQIDTEKWKDDDEVNLYIILWF